MYNTCILSQVEILGSAPIVGSSHRFLIYGLIPLEPVDPVERFFRPILTSIDPGVEQVSLLYEHSKQFKKSNSRGKARNGKADGLKEVTKPYKANEQLAS